MDNVIQLQQPGEDFQRLASEKIASELDKFAGDSYGQAVKDFVASTLTNFCQQNARFAEVVYKTKRSLSDCCAAIMKGCGNHISDIDVYRGAVRYYFPNSEIEFQMNIKFTGEAPTEAEMEKPAERPAPTKKQKPKTQTAKPKAKEPAPAPANPKRQEKPKAQEPEMLQLTLF